MDTFNVSKSDPFDGNKGYFLRCTQTWHGTQWYNNSSCSTNGSCCSSPLHDKLTMPSSSMSEAQKPSTKHFLSSLGPMNPVTSHLDTFELHELLLLFFFNFLI